MAIPGPRQARRQLHVQLGPQQIDLSASAGECPGDDQAARGRGARVRLAFMSDEQLNLMQKRRAHDGLLRIGDLLLVVLEVRAGRSERRAADTAVPVALVFEVRPDREGDAFAPLAGDAECQQRLAVRLRSDVVNLAGRTDREHDRLLIFHLVVPGKQKRCPAGAAERTAEHPFDDAATLGRSGRRKRVARVQRGIAEDDIGFAVIVLRARLGEDFDPSPSGTRVLRGIRILVDLDLLDSRRAHSQRTDFHPVDDKGRTGGADRSGIEEPRERGDVILIEHRKGGEHLLIDGHGIGVRGCAGADFRRLIADRDFLGDVCERKRDPQRRWRAATDSHLDRCRLESLVADSHLVAARRHADEPERARRIGRRCLNDRRPRHEIDLRAGKHGARPVDCYADDRLSASRRLGFPGRDCCGEQQPDNDEHREPPTE